MSLTLSTAPVPYPDEHRRWDVACTQHLLRALSVICEGCTTLLGLQQAGGYSSCLHDRQLKIFMDSREPAAEMASEV